jgi:CPA1 family monovalent cation:H+ antiporter
MFNDGIAVAILVFVKNILQKSAGKNIALLVLSEIGGAIFTGIAMSFIMFKILRMSNEPVVHVLVSLLNVAMINIICGTFGFSGVVASVVAGLYFSMQSKKIVRWREVVDSKELYNDFWNVAASILGSVLYVMVGLSILSIDISMKTLILIPIAVIVNLVSRFVGATVGSNIVGKKHLPSKYSNKEFASLLTISALKGGVSLAMAMTLKDILALETYNIILTVVLITILFTTIIQGLLSGKLYDRVEKRREKKYAERSLCVK